MPIELLEIEVPAEFVSLASYWYDGQNDKLYAIASTGNLTMGTIRPYSTECVRMMNDHEWHRSLFSDLSCDIRNDRKSAEKSGHEDADELQRFEQWADSIVEKMDEVYKDVMYQD